MLKQEQIDIFTSMENYLQNVLATMPHVIGAYRNADVEKIDEYSVPLIEGFQWLNEALSLTHELHDISMEDIKDILSELLNSFEYEDTVLTADILEFEIAPKLEIWLGEISDILKLN